MDRSTVPGCMQKDDWNDDITSGQANPDPDSIAGRRNCANANRPEPTGEVCTTFEIENEDGERREYHSVGVKRYPDPPKTLDEETLVSYIYEYERAYSQNSAVLKYGKRLKSASVSIKEDLTQALDFYEEITVVGVEFANPLTIKRGNRFSNEDNFSDAAVYGIDETGIVRSGAEPDEIRNQEVPDPIEYGDLLECF